MRLSLDDDNVILGYTNLGDLTDSVNFTGNIPNNFVNNFKSTYFVLNNDQITINPNYVEPNNTITLPPSNVETQLAALAYQQMTSQQTITDLQTQNAQMAYQLMTQGGVTA